MVRKVHPKEVCIFCTHPIADCRCARVSRKKRLVRMLKGRPVEDTPEVQP